MGHVDFCGEIFDLSEQTPTTLGRQGTIVIDDNKYLHRHFLELSYKDSLWWLSNIGGTLTATLADDSGLTQSWLSPGASVPIVFKDSVVWFTAGPTTYEFEIHLDDAPFMAPVTQEAADGQRTLGGISLAPEHTLLILSLAEPILRRGNRGSGSIPQSAAAAKRLGWTTTKFNRKLDYLCEKLSRTGVQGLISAGGRSASNRRARLVEYALATRMVTVDDLALLNALGGH